MKRKIGGQKPPRGKTLTAHDPNPSATARPKRAGKLTPVSPKPKRKAKAAVTIGPGATSTQDVWLDKA